MIKSRTEFYPHSKTGLRSECKLCSNLHGKQYRNTLHGCLMKLLFSSRQHIVRRSSIRKPLDHNITYNFLCLRNSIQHQRCYYSGIPMHAATSTKWMMSLERLWQHRGYTKNNIVLVCLEFNSSKQWSVDKVIYCVKNYSKTNVLESIQQAQDSLVKITTVIVNKKQSRKDAVDSNDNPTTYCIRCKLYQLQSLFLKNISLGCFLCRKLVKQQYGSTLRGFIYNLLHITKRSTKQRITKGRSMEFDIDLNYLINIVIEQKGRCYYSNMPLIFKRSSDWICSVERLNCNLGYIKGNIVLVCYEFNSFNRIGQNVTPENSSQWSKDKFTYFIECAKAKYHI